MRVFIWLNDVDLHLSGCLRTEASCGCHETAVAFVCVVQGMAGFG
jgi:hypothetical protein